MKTAVINTIHNAEQRDETPNKADVAKSFTVCAVDGLVDALEKERKKSGLKTVAVAGGVGANSYLRNRLKEFEKRGVRVCLPRLDLCGDNAAMIASRGYFMYEKGQFADLSLNACPTLKLRGDKPRL